MNVFIIGSSGHARVVADMVRQDARYRLAGLIDRFRVVGESSFGVEVLGGESDLPRLVRRHEIEAVFLGVGDNFVRAEIASRVRQLCPSLLFPPLMHHSAQIAGDVVVGEGGVFCAGAIVCPGAHVGRFCLLNTRAILEHDSSMADGSSLASGVLVGGRCRIGVGSAIGIGGILTHGVEIGDHSVIGAGALVNQSIGNLLVAYGLPAKVIRTRTVGERYL